MYKSKCTCAHRHPSQNVRAWNLTHSDDCYYAEVLKRERQEQKDIRVAKILYKHYKRSGVK
jgi:hypothetical protein